MTRRVIPAGVREGLGERLEDLEARQIPELERQAAAGDVGAVALLAALRRERDQLLDAVAADAAEAGDQGAWDPRRIEVGDEVSVREVGSDEDQHYILVPSGVGCRVEDGWVSDGSPLGAALVGAARGEIVEVPAPGGVLRYLIVDFRAA